MKKLFVLVIAACALMAACADKDGARAMFDERGNLSGVVYGEDSVRDLSDKQIQGSPQFMKNAQASAALIDIQELAQKADRTWGLNDKTVEERYRTCPEFKMSEQVSAAFCSAILISPKMILTAGHCLSAEAEHACEGTAVVFGFDRRLDQSADKKLQSSQVYRCKRIVQINNNERRSGVDFALVELDRVVEGVQPVAMPEQIAPVALSRDIYTIGYPVGTSKKTASGRVRSFDAGSQNPRASLDIYYGNSGGPVFDKATDQLVGVVMNGEEDFVQTKNHCQMPKLCSDEGCAGEEISTLAKISKFMNPQLLKALQAPGN